MILIEIAHDHRAILDGAGFTCSSPEMQKLCETVIGDQKHLSESGGALEEQNLRLIQRMLPSIKVLDRRLPHRPVPVHPEYP